MDSVGNCRRRRMEAGVGLDARPSNACSRRWSRTHTMMSLAPVSKRHFRNESFVDVAVKLVSKRSHVALERRGPFRKDDFLQSINFARRYELYRTMHGRRILLAIAGRSRQPRGEGGSAYSSREV